MIEFSAGFIPTNPLVVLLVVLTCLFLTREYQRNLGVPPGPYGLPWIGYVFFLNPQRVSQQMAEMCRKYKSDIICITSVGNKLTMLNSYDLMKEVYQKRTDAADRPDTSLFRSVDPDFTGIIGNSGPAWREARRFSISALRDFGMGRVGAEEMIQDESKVLYDLIKNQKEVPFDPERMVNIAVSNIICGMVFGQRFEHNDPEFTEALDGMNEFVRGMNNIPLFALLQFKFAREYIRKKRLFKVFVEYERMSKFVKKKIEEHKKEYTGQSTDLIYCYMKDVEQGRDPEIFDDKMLESLIVDFFFAGSETTYSTLRWCLLAMAAYPEIQKKVQEELDEVIGERKPSMGDKKQTPYTEAVLSEIQRYFTLIPLGVAHTNLNSDIYVSGYRIPKDSFIGANIREIHRDRKTWKNPDNFDPENFLEEGKVSNLEKLVPFGIGRRACAGEALARMELYIFFTSLVKNFEIKLETDDSKADLVGNLYAVYQPKPFKIRMKARY